jgi:hypothetical protein
MPMTTTAQLAASNLSIPTSTGNLRVCFGCRKIHNEEDMWLWCGGCNNYLCGECRQVECPCPMPPELQAELDAESKAA